MANTLYNFRETDFSQPPVAEWGIAMLNGSLTGLLVKGFLDSMTVENILTALHALNSNRKTIVNNGFVSYPLTFAQYTQARMAGQLTESEYALVARMFVENFSDEFGTDVTDRLTQYLSKLFPEAQIGPIMNSQRSGPLIPFTFRELLPGNGELIAHCENLFFTEFPQYFDWLQVLDVKNNKFSFFITLQEANEGGELCCFDLNWEDVKTRLEPSLLQSESGHPIDLNDDVGVRRMLIKPKAGDLLLFCGGDVWHRVEKVEGTNSRITLGGFVAEAFTPDTYYLWS